MSKDTIEDQISILMSKSPYIHKNHEKLYNIIGKGVWLYRYDHNIKILDIQPIYVPQESIIMFVNDIRFYRIADECSESIIPILIIVDRGISVNHKSFIYTI